MARYIRLRQIAELPEDEHAVPLAEWNGQPALLLGAADDPLQLAGRLDGVTLIAIDFPMFTDGRGYSTARLLRERLKYTGELRAVGDVPRDSLFYLSCCGFDGFVLDTDAAIEPALASLSDFSDAYQTSVARPQPLFRRRAG
jgi:uncharacterized protein (DUF934 family)